MKSQESGCKIEDELACGWNLSDARSGEGNELFRAICSYFERCRNKALIQLFALFDGQSSAEALGLSIEIESNVGGWSYGGGVLRQDAAPKAPSEHVRDPAGWVP